ncbi:arylalkylamine N-acetyltransferase-like 2 [Procambarus clarkii]|uniref:arylalkylamine N-acetyltransferase-like 2 n=1 Tax=Procambarus clarkii TaxID=6728 RepID=UPI001E6752E5|nr:arylalkylamine N-acetyltransferase-like 2 [Procambarus clarkii]
MEVSSNIELSVMTPDDFEETITLLREQYCYRNPLCRALGVKKGETNQEPLTTLIRKCLASGLSVSARDKTSQTLAGIFLNLPQDVDETSEDDDVETEVTSKVFRVLKLLAAGTHKVFQEMNVKVVLELFTLCVHEDYGGQGLGSKLTEKSLLLGEEQGYAVASVMCTNSLTERICARFGFDTVKTLNLISVADKLGNDICLIPGETDLKMMIKMISS